MAGDGAHAQELIDTLILPNYQKWYTESFDEEVARAGLALYDPAASSLGAQLARYFINAQQSHPEIQAVRFAETCDDNAKDHTFGLLLSRLRPVPLYEVRFIKDGKFSRLFAFVYVDGGFRFVVLPDPEKVVPHRLRALTDTSKQTEVIAGRDMPPVQTIRQGGAITAAHLIHREQPEYPEVARRERIQGTIRLRAIIGKDGTISGLRVMSGKCSLSKSAYDAVRKWRYSPTTINGEPVEVDTTIDVIYFLNQ